MGGVEDKENREKSIRAEKKRLNGLYAKISDKKKKTIAGLIERAAFMRVSLAELEDDLNTYGFTEYFSQGDQEPYQRKRPTADLYNTMNTSYQKIIKQLTDLLPREPFEPERDDGFGDFVDGRDDA